MIMGLDEFISQLPSGSILYREDNEVLTYYPNYRALEDGNPYITQHIHECFEEFIHRILGT